METNGIKGKMFAKKRYAEKALMKKTIAMHEQKITRRKMDDNVQEGAVRAYLLDRDATTRAKVLSNTEYKLETFTGVYRKFCGKNEVFEYPLSEAS
ncbi:hypothetical protein SUGI_0217840 [Cryptomeria japonica]|nr:hypothetical protein SUGI_0217840 [Cryptomeria japonica]